MKMEIISSKKEIAQMLKDNGIIAHVKLRTDKTGFWVDCKYAGEDGMFKASRLFEFYSNVSVSYGCY